MSPRLQVRLLGQFEATLDERPLTKLIGGRLQSLFTYLVLHGGAPQSRSHLAFQFWPDAVESNARNNLRQLLHQLREALREAGRFVRTTPSSVQWEPAEPCVVDVTAMTAALDEADEAGRSGDALRGRSALGRAVDLCGGPLVPSCYDDWIVPERDRLARRCIETIAQLVKLFEATREYQLAIPYVYHWLQHDPTDEEAYRQLMRLCALAHDRGAALRAFRDCRQTLQRELGTEPSEETLRLHELIERADRTIGGARDAEGPSLPLIGRNEAFLALRKAWDAAAVGAARFVLITGEAGIGKSRLATELVSWARLQGIATATTRCYAAEGRLALAPVTDWLRSEALRQTLTGLEDIWFAEVSRIVPELATERHAAPQTGLSERQRLFEGLVHAVLVAPQPLLLVIDDLQWCDPETLQWLHFLLRFKPSPSLLVLATVRSEELARSHPVNELRLQLTEEMVATEIALDPLDAGQTATLASLVANRPIDAETATRLFRETEGNPLYVVEMVRGDDGRQPLHAIAEGASLPPRVQAVIAGRLARLSPVARQVVSATATVARACSLMMLAQTLRCSDQELIAALDELWQKRILREQQPNSYDFTHDKLREVAYEEISAPERRSLHRIVARALEVAEESNLDRVSGQIAAHFDRAGLAEQAIPYYIRAAAFAQSVYANSEAQTQVERGLALIAALPETSKRDRWELELQLVLAPVLRVTCGWGTPEVESVLHRALALSDKVATPAQRTQVLYGLQSVYIVQGKHERAQLLADEIADLLQRMPGGERPLSAAAMIAGAQLMRGRFNEAIGQWDDLLRSFDPQQIRLLQDSQGLNYRVLTLAWQSHALWCVGRSSTAFERCREAVELASALGQPFNQALATTYLALLQQLRADAATFREQADEALQVSEAFEAPYYRAWASILVAYARACAKPRLESIAEMREVIARFTGTGARLRLTYYLALVADVCRRAEEPERGLAAIEEALAAARESGERWWDAELHRLRGDLLTLRGAGAEEADAAYRRALDVARAQGARSLELRAAMGLMRLWRTSPGAADAKLLLAQTAQSFSEGFEAPDLVAARSLLLEIP